MNNSLSIRLEGLGKVYKLFPSPFDRVKETFLSGKNITSDSGLSDISLRSPGGNRDHRPQRSGKTTLPADLRHPPAHHRHGLEKRG